MISSVDNSPISAAESTRRIWLEEDNKQARDHDIAVRKLELEVMKIDARWSSVWKLPITIVKLPVYIVMAIGYCISVARKVEPGDQFWSFLR